MIWLHHSMTYRLEGVLSIHEIQGAEQQPSLGVLVALGPTLAQHVPFWLELPAELASESLFQRCKEDCDRVVSWRLGQLRIAGVVKLQWSTRRQ